MQAYLVVTYRGDFRPSRGVVQNLCKFIIYGGGGGGSKNERRSVCVVGRSSGRKCFEM